MKTANIRIPAPEPNVIIRQIGSTTFKVNLHFDLNAKESLNEKVLRLLKNDLQSTPENVKMKTLQAGWLSERSSA